MSWQAYGVFAHDSCDQKRDDGTNPWSSTWHLSTWLVFTKRIDSLLRSHHFRIFFNAVQLALTEVAMHSDIKQLDKKLNKARGPRVWPWIFWFEMVGKSGHIGGWSVSYTFVKKRPLQHPEVTPATSRSDPCNIQKIMEPESKEILFGKHHSPFSPSISRWKCLRFFYRWYLVIFVDPLIACKIGINCTTSGYIMFDLSFPPSFFTLPGFWTQHRFRIFWSFFFWGGGQKTTRWWKQSELPKRPPRLPLLIQSLGSSRTWWKHPARLDGNVWKVDGSIPETNSFRPKKLMVGIL